MLYSFWSYNSSTILLYISIVAFSTLFASISQKLAANSNDTLYSRITYRVPFFISFAILAFFACTTSVGIDRSAYTYIFRISSFENPYKHIEPGFQLLIGIIKIFTDNDKLFLGAISFITIALVYKGIWDCRNDLSIGLAVFIFSSQYYLQSFNLIRMYFAMSFLIAGFKLLRNGKYIRYLILILVAASIHYSMIFAAIAYIISLLFMKAKPTSFGIMFILSIIASVIFIYLSINFAVGLVDSENAIIDKYSLYLEETSKASVGLKWIFNLIPYALIIMLAKCTDKKQFYLSISTGYSLIAFIVSVLSYSIPTLGRALICLNMPIIIMIPMVIETLNKNEIINKKNNVIVRNNMSFCSVHIFTIIYFVSAFLLYLYEYLYKDGIDNFKFIWN